MKRPKEGGDEVSALEERIGYTFQHRELAREALTHASQSNEMPNLPCNERLEFLGDAVLELIVSSHLYRTYPTIDEGRMTKVRAAVVSEPSLMEVAQGFDLMSLLAIGRGTERIGGRNNPSILSDAVEAIIGAIYLDGGLEAAGSFILPRLLPGIAVAVEEGFVLDNKTRLQELLQRNGEIKIEYVLDGEEGAPHSRVFNVSLLVDGKPVATGQGKNKKDAQQNAAGRALAALQLMNDEGRSSERAPEKP